MRHVSFDPQLLDADAEISETEKVEFRAWLVKATEAATKAVEYYEEKQERPKEKEEIWAADKHWLLRNKFHWKCAYCEQSVSGIPREAEHWRPKRGITFGLGEDESEPTHPGYFWLAYSWQNLLPSCSFCNSYAGKKNAFPTTQAHVFVVDLTPAEVAVLKGVAIASKTTPGRYYLAPEDLDERERPDLLHPYYDEPRDHLQFETNGQVFAKTPKGTRSIAVFDLDRQDLDTKRAAEQTMAMNRFEVARNSAIVFQKQKAAEAVAAGWSYVDNYTSGTAAFSTAAVSLLEALFPRPVGESHGDG